MTWPLSPNSVRNARERKPETTMTLINVMPEITQRSLLPHSLCLNSVATHWPTLRKGEIKLHVSDEGVSKNSLTYFNVTTVCSAIFYSPLQLFRRHSGWHVISSIITSKQNRNHSIILTIEQNNFSITDCLIHVQMSLIVSYFSYSWFSLFE